MRFRGGIDEGSDPVSVREIVNLRGTEGSGNFFFEAEFNAYGYAFLQMDRPDEAIRVFKINVELFPDSWNVYDSLGEDRGGRSGNGTPAHPFDC